MKTRKQTQVIQWREGKIPSSIKIGRVFLKIGAILFLVGSVLSLTSWIICLIGHWVDLGPYWSEVFPELAFWEDSIDLVDVVSDGFMPAIYVAMFLSGVGAFSYLKDKGPFIDWVSWAAIIGLGVLLFEFFSNVRDLILLKVTWGQIAVQAIFLQFDFLFYSIGWFLAKNWLD